MRTLQVSANYYDMSVVPTFSAYLNTTQTLSNGAYTKVIFDTTEWDTTGAYNTTTGDWTPSAGVYKVMFTVCGFLVGDLSTSMNMRNTSATNYPYITQYVFHRTGNLAANIQTDGSHTYAVYVGIYADNFTTDGRVWGAGDVSSDYSYNLSNYPWISGGEGLSGINATDAIQRSYFQAYMTKPNG